MPEQQPDIGEACGAPIKADSIPSDTHDCHSCHSDNETTTTTAGSTGEDYHSTSDPHEQQGICHCTELTKGHTCERPQEWGGRYQE